jgi:hypothetical protein
MINRATVCRDTSGAIDPVELPRDQHLCLVAKEGKTLFPPPTVAVDGNEYLEIRTVIWPPSPDFPGYTIKQSIAGDTVNATFYFDFYNLNS